VADILLRRFVFIAGTLRVSDMPCSPDRQGGSRSSRAAVPRYFL
jgi:hypothetical protein